MTPIIFPYKFGSRSARALARSLNSKCVRKNGTYRYKKHHLIINWGASQAPVWNRNDIRILNHWDKIKVSHNKLTALNKLKENNVSTVEFTTDINSAKIWIKEGNITIKPSLIHFFA